MPHPGVEVRQGEAGLGAGRIEQAQLHAVGELSHQREVGAPFLRGGAQHMRTSRPHRGDRRGQQGRRGHGLATPFGDAAQHVAQGRHVAVAAADRVGDHPGPAGLVGGAQPGAVVAVEVLVEHQVVLPGRVGLEPVDAPEAGTAAVRADQEDRNHALAQVLGDLAEGQFLPRPGRVLD